METTSTKSSALDAASVAISAMQLHQLNTITTHLKTAANAEREKQQEELFQNSLREYLFQYQVVAETMEGSAEQNATEALMVLRATRAYYEKSNIGPHSFSSFSDKDRCRAIQQSFISTIERIEAKYPTAKADADQCEEYKSDLNVLDGAIRYLEAEKRAASVALPDPVVTELQKELDGLNAKLNIQPINIGIGTILVISFIGATIGNFIGMSVKAEEGGTIVGGICGFLLAVGCAQGTKPHETPEIAEADRRRKELSDKLTRANELKQTLATCRVDLESATSKFGANSLDGFQNLRANRQNHVSQYDSLSLQKLSHASPLKT